MEHSVKGSELALCANLLTPWYSCCSPGRLEMGTELKDLFWGKKGREPYDRRGKIEDETLVGFRVSSEESKGCGVFLIEE